MDVNRVHRLAATFLVCVPLGVGSHRGTVNAQQADTTPGTLEAAVDGPCRTTANVRRDVYRHPLDTLQFFGIDARMRVIEITPGYCWYCEILAPYLSRNGEYIAAVHVASAHSEAPNVLWDAIKEKFAATPECFRLDSIRTFDIAAPVLGPPNSADLVLTFRNVHNWQQDGYAERMFVAIAAVLKPGATLGVTDHRADGPNPAPGQSPAGYISEKRVIDLAEQAGLELIGRSEINANRKDRKNYPAGVWTLPPTLALGEQDMDTYLAIGESDRMTLLFRKPMRLESRDNYRQSSCTAVLS